MAAYTCTYHPERGVIDEYCPLCIQEHEERRNAESMTGDERAAEVARLFSGVLSRPFEMIHKRIQELVGRPVWTHELGLRADELIEEARSRPRDTPISGDEIRDKVIGSIPPDKPVIVVQLDPENE
jgi:hypothetical protein